VATSVGQRTARAHWLLHQRALCQRLVEEESHEVPRLLRHGEPTVPLQALRVDEPEGDDLRVERGRGESGGPADAVADDGEVFGAEGARHVAHEGRAGVGVHPRPDLPLRLTEAGHVDAHRAHAVARESRREVAPVAHVARCAVHQQA
jgi:hypothetical protein